MKNKSSLLTPFLNWSDNSRKFLKIFQILYYYVPAVGIPVYGIVAIVRSFNYFAIFTTIGLTLFIILASFFSFNILWSRAKELIVSSEKNKFFIVPAISHYIKTQGEVIFAIFLSSTIFFLFLQLDQFLGNYPYFFFEEIEATRFLSGAPIFGIILLPLYGYFIMLVSKLISELFSAVVEIANNTSK